MMQPKLLLCLIGLFIPILHFIGITYSSGVLPNFWIFLIGNIVGFLIVYGLAFYLVSYIEEESEEKYSCTMEVIKWSVLLQISITCVLFISYITGMYNNLPVWVQNYDSVFGLMGLSVDSYIFNIASEKSDALMIAGFIQWAGFVYGLISFLGKAIYIIVQVAVFMITLLPFATLYTLYKNLREKIEST